MGRDLNQESDRKFRKEVNRFRDAFHKQTKPTTKPDLLSHDACTALTQAEQVLMQAFESPTFSVSQEPCVLLEIYANEHSPLTGYLQSQGFNAIRFTMSYGDLSTLDGQAKLWSVINKHQPLHIWVAPECGPWSGWNHLNMYKSNSLV